MWENGYPNSSGFHSYHKMRLRIALLKTSCSMHQTMTITAYLPIMYWSATLLKRLFSRHVCGHLFQTVIVLEQITDLKVFMRCIEGFTMSFRMGQPGSSRWPFFMCKMSSGFSIDSPCSVTAAFIGVEPPRGAEEADPRSADP